MACCKCCCGGVDCAEGDQGKCCCGGASGTCCQADEYCCSGVCQSTPCIDCATFDTTPCEVSCGTLGCNNDAMCLDGSYLGGTETNQGCLDYYAACCPTCVFYYDEFGELVTTTCEPLP